MTDSTHNTLVTLMIIIGVVIAIILIGRGLRPGYAYQGYFYQPANALGAYTANRSYEPTPRYSDTVTSYSRPSRYTDFGTVKYVDTTYTTYTTYECSPDGVYCWTN